MYKYHELLHTRKSALKVTCVGFYKHKTCNFVLIFDSQNLPDIWYPFISLLKYLNFLESSEGNVLGCGGHPNHRHHYLKRVSTATTLDNTMRHTQKCTLVQALRLCTSHMAHRRSRGITLPFYDHRKGWGVSVTSRLLFTSGRNPVPIVQEDGWAPGPVWTGAENLAPTGIRSPDRPAHSQSLYWQRYPAYVFGVDCTYYVVLLFV